MRQAEVIDILKTGANVFLTGEPGSGKTHTLREYLFYLRKNEVDVAVTASTGIAATHIGGVTIHSWSGIGIKKFLSVYDLEFLSENKHLAKRIKKTRVLVIDEISMLDAQTLDNVERVCCSIRQNSLPFGGIQTVLVGDFFQLPPVARQGEVPPKFAFEGKSWQAGNFVTCYLSEQHRQVEQVFSKLLSAIRSGCVENKHRDTLDNCCLLDGDFPQSAIRLYSHNADVDKINELELAKVFGEIFSFQMQTSGRPKLIEQLKRGCLSPEKLNLKIGAVVMFTKNSPQGLFVNGTLGKVINFESSIGFPVVKTNDGKEIVAEPMEWMIEDDGRVLARASQVPLRLAWAITVHKSQGMSLDAAFVDLRKAFTEGQGYVALSRVRNLSGLYLAGYNEKALCVHPEIIKYDNEMRAVSEEFAKVFTALSSGELSQMHDNFLHAVGVAKKKKRQKATSN